MLNLSDFNYELPADLIAQEPARPRDHARLMVIDREAGTISHHHIYDLPDLLGPKWSLVANNTKVFPARLTGHKPTGGKVEVLLLHPLGHSRYKCISKPGLKKDSKVIFSEGLTCQVIAGAGQDVRETVIVFNQPEKELRESISLQGSMPTPPYIKKMLADNADYQTVYAKYGFSAAAPTAGLHFTPELLKKIKSEHSWHEITLDVGLGTFLPVHDNDITKHHMHEEHFTVSPSVASALNEAKERGKLLAVGTTTTRALESSVDVTGRFIPQTSDTGIYIYPPRLMHIDGLLTNFHLPESTLLMLVSAFMSVPNSSSPFTSFRDSLLGEAYATAVREKYRFFSFGDAMLII